MRVYLLPILAAAIVGCREGSAPANRLEVRVAAPSSVAGRSVQPGTPTIQYCGYDVVVTVSGGAPGDEIQLEDAEIIGPGIIHFSADIVGSWFGTSGVLTGESEAAHLETPILNGTSMKFEHRIFYRLPTGERHVLEFSVQCNWT